MNSAFLQIGILASSLIVILISCEIFTNAIEWFGRKLKVGEGLIGSIFAAVGTCLPETLVPIIAIFGGEKDIGVGAIAGAPFMLSTLAFFIMGFAVIIYSIGKKRTVDMKINTQIISRDISFFIIVYSIGILASFVESRAIKVVTAVFLVMAYIYYIYLTAKNDLEHFGELEDLIFTRIFHIKTQLNVIIVQLIIAMIGIVVGAHFFVEALKQVSNIFHVPGLILSLIIAPIATELPEKFNSIIWLGKRKDTLALGNMTGAMVFQSCIPVSIGLLFTSWFHLQLDVLLSAAAAILSAIMNYIALRINGKMSPYILLLSGLFYFVTIFIIISTVKLL